MAKNAVLGNDRSNVLSEVNLRDRFVDWLNCVDWRDNPQQEDQQDAQCRNAWSGGVGFKAVHATILANNPRCWAAWHHLVHVLARISYAQHGGIAVEKDGFQTRREDAVD